MTDVVCPMYPSVEALSDLSLDRNDDRPIVLCEYSHAMNNSNGNLHLYWEKFWDDSNPRIQGGFIWDMIDQGLRKKNKGGREYFGYGGDFGDVINDRQFCINVCLANSIPLTFLFLSNTENACRVCFRQTECRTPACQRSSTCSNRPPSPPATPFKSNVKGTDYFHGMGILHRQRILFCR